MKIHFITFGCKVNQCETENLIRRFALAGHDTAASQKEAELIVINTCTVTSSADKKNIRALRRARKENPDAAIAMIGCFPQASRRSAAEMPPEADIIIGNKRKQELPALAERFFKERKRIIEIEDFYRGEGFEKISAVSFSRHTRAFVKIQDGCDRFCSYCIIPHARGRTRSKPAEELRAEAEKLAENGYREIVLVGIDLSSYGKEFGMTLSDAVEICDSVDGIERIRIGSLEPHALTESELARLAGCKKLCPQFHLSLQSGCDRTLLAMNRHYTTREYKDLLCRIRAAFPDAAITTDIMTGFPGESDEDFAESLKFVRECGFARAHIFPYSARNGTVAAAMPNRIPPDVKRWRTEEMTAAVRESEREFISTLKGRVFPVLFERENCTEFHRGYTPNYTLIKIPRKNPYKSLRGEIFYAKIVEVDEDFCIGELTDCPPPNP